MTTLTPEALDDIESKAKEATGGVWRAQGNSDGRPVVTTGAGKRGVAYTWLVADAEYLATLDPATVLALVAECRELRRLRAVLDFLYRNEAVPEVRPAAELIGLALSLGWKEDT